MYISLYSNFDRKFKGNQSYTHARGVVTVRDDDTTYIYKNMSRKDLKQFKKDYAETGKGNFKMTGAYPNYYIQYNN